MARPMTTQDWTLLRTGRDDSVGLEWCAGITRWEIGRENCPVARWSLAAANRFLGGTQ